MNIYVSNLGFNVQDEDLRGLFTEHGAVLSAKVIIDKFTKQSRGFGFVEVSTREEMEKETKRLNGFLFKGRNLVVGEAKANLEKAERRRATHP